MDFYIDLLKQYTWLGNTFYDYSLAILIFLLSLLILKIFQVIIFTRLKKLSKKTKTEIDDVFLDIVSSVKPPLYFLISVYLAYQVLTFSTQVDQTVGFVIFVLVVYEVIRSCSQLLDYLIDRHAQKQKTEGQKRQAKTTMGILKTFLVIGLWLVAIVLVLSNYGVNVSSIIASLGIGGLAVALALQNILTDVFSSFSIFVDKPFQIGDYIMIGTDSGTVQKIGLKTTRIRTLQGEELIISNKELTTARVQNYKRMERRRILFNLGVVYNTSAEKLERIPALIEKIIGGVKQATFGRCHFISYGESSLNFETVYYVESKEYIDYANVNQEINLEIFRVFAKEKIEFAYPTQTVHIEK